MPRLRLLDDVRAEAADRIGRQLEDVFREFHFSIPSFELFPFLFPS
jgi:hypothetical protein